MEVKIVRENMEAAQVFAAKPMQAVVETEAALPGGLRDEARVYSAEANVQTNGGELAGGRITVDGRVTFHVLYAQGNLAHVAALETTADFSQALPIREDGASAAGVRIAPRAAVEQVSAKAFNGRLLLRAVLSLSADAEALRPVSYVCDATGESCVEKDAGEIDVQRVVGEGEIQSLQKEEFELSDVLQIRETLYATGHAQVEDILGGADGRATVTGTIAIEAYHTADMPGRPLVYTRHTMPFEQTIGLSGASGDALAAQCDVRDVAVLSQDAGDGRKIMRAEVELHTVVSALENVKLPVLRDVYTTAGDMLDNTRQRVTYRTGMINEQTAESGRAVLMLPENSPRVKTAPADCPGAAAGRQAGHRRRSGNDPDLCRRGLRNSRLHGAGDALPRRVCHAGRAGRRAEPDGDADGGQHGYGRPGRGKIYFASERRGRTQGRNRGCYRGSARSGAGARARPDAVLPAAGRARVGRGQALSHIASNAGGV